MMPVFNSSFAEYKFSKFKKRVSREQVFPKTLSLEFARTLIPTRAATSNGRNSADASEGAAMQDVSGDGAGGVNDDSRSEPSGAPSENTPAPLPPRTPLARAPTMMGGALAGLIEQSNQSRPATTANLVRAPSSANLNLPPGGVLSRPASSANGLARMPSMMSIHAKVSLPPTPHTAPRPSVSQHAASAHEDEDDFEDFSLTSSTQRERDKERREVKAADVDFFRTCALCELRLPRSAMDIKVFRKHVVKLRSSWDPKLVSKEIRSLDNTISMYNLVDICLFCSQYFDPDFPDGIAYPIRTNPNGVPIVPGSSAAKDPALSSSGVVKAISSQQAGSAKYVPFYDIRYMNCDIDVGAVFQRPRTVESRHRARRATEIAVAHDKKMASFAAASAT